MKKKIIIALLSTLILTLSACSESAPENILESEPISAQETVESSESSTSDSSEEEESTSQSTSQSESSESEIPEQSSSAEEPTNLPDINELLYATVKNASDSLLALEQGYLPQTDLNLAAREQYDIWDAFLNELWNYLYPSLPATEKESLLEDQRSWIQSKEDEVKKQAADFEGGSMQPLIEYSTGARITRERCYYLAKLLAGKWNQPYEFQNLSGFYADTQGTDDIYSELILNIIDKDTYCVSIGIYRLTTFEGIATLKEDGSLYFEDTEMNVFGNITLSENSAVFTVTHSEFGYVQEGEQFEFPTKMNDYIAY